MAFFSAIATAASALASSAGTIGAGLSAIGTVAGVAGQFQQAAGNRKAQNAQKRAEALRMKQAELDADRKRRETIRQQQIARANALATTTAQGASAEGGSALGGAEGTIGGQAGRNIQEINSNLEFGRGIYKANQDSAAGYAMAARGGTLSSAGQGIASLGGQLVKNMKDIYKIGGFGADAYEPGRFGRN